MDQAVRDALGPAKPGFEWVEKRWPDSPCQAVDKACGLNYNLGGYNVYTYGDDPYTNGQFTAAARITGRFYRQEPVKKISGSGTLRFNDLGLMQGLPVADGLGIGVNNAKNKTFRITYEEV